MGSNPAENPARPTLRAAREGGFQPYLEHPIAIELVRRYAGRTVAIGPSPTPNRGNEFMKNYRAVRSHAPFPGAAAGRDSREADEGNRDGLPKGWQEFPTGLQGARLFRLAPPAGGDPEWKAELKIDGEVWRLRCASELRARAWLAVQGKPSFTLSGFDGSERNQRFRANFPPRE